MIASAYNDYSPEQCDALVDADEAGALRRHSDGYEIWWIGTDRHEAADVDRMIDKQELVVTMFNHRGEHIRVAPAWTNKSISK